MKAYASAQEHLAHCLAALDALLRQFCAAGGPHYRRGMVMTQQEAQAFLSGQTPAPQPPSGGLQTVWQQIEQREVLTVAAGRILPLQQVAAAFGLDTFGSFCLLLAASVQADRKYEMVYSYLQDSTTGVHPTLGLAQALYAAAGGNVEQQPPWGQEGRFCFLPPAGDTLLSSPLRLRPRVAAFLLGQEAPPTLPDGILHYLNPDGLDELFLHTATRDALLRLIGEVGEKGGQLLVHLIGAPGTGRKLLLRTVSAQTGLPFLSVDVQRLPEDERAGQALLDEITTEAYLTESAVHLEVRGALQPEQAEAFRRLEDALATRVPIVCVTAAPDELPRVLPRAHVVTLELGEADITQREQIWQYYAKPCPLADDISLTAYASRYYLTPDQIRRSLFSAMTLAAARGQAQVTDAMLSQAVMQNRSVHIDGLAQRLQSTFTWDDIELPDEQRSLLQLAGARMRLRRCVEEDWGFRRKVTYGRGVSVLLHGPPGTGKTMAAQVLANDIGMELYRVDLSQVVDKYIGETEKNLARIFDSAQKSNVILFFDEADALFSKRTEVTSSNDRHANAETAYILQRIETYDGMTILATNLSNNFDPAFMRRITYTVRFEMPDEAMRLRLWQKNLPPAAPRAEGLDLAFFAKTFALSGSAIKQILLNAAYMAAMEEKPISARHLVRAVKYDAIKSGRICEREQFGVYASYY